MSEAEEQAVRSMGELASLAWKLSEAIAREAAAALPERAQAGEAMLRFARRRLDAILGGHEMRVVCFDGEEWSAQIPANPLNLDEIENGEAVVDATVEPTIMRGTNVILPGKILLRNN